MGQTTSFFSGFKGDVYDIPLENVSLGYGPHIYEYNKITSIDWPEIKVPDQECDKDFPDVPRNKLFGMVLYSSMEVKKEGCFVFVLNTDDGSKLWIDDKLYIDNGGDHGMRAIVDTVSLNKGKHDIKIWYFQAYATRYGFEFDAKYLGPPEKCQKKPVKVHPVVAKIKHFVFSDIVFFDTDKYLIKEDAVLKLDSITELIMEHNPQKIKVIGHTDSDGETAYNELLSQRRSQAIIRALIERVNKPEIQYHSDGFGESRPISSNETEEGRAQNRRVEIILE